MTAFYLGLEEYQQVAKNEIGFINFFIKPFWMEIKQLDAHKLTMIESNINDNILQWEEQYQL